MGMFQGRPESSTSPVPKSPRLTRRNLQRFQVAIYAGYVIPNIIDKFKRDHLWFGAAKGAVFPEGQSPTMVTSASSENPREYWR